VTLRGRRKPVTVLTLENDAHRYSTEATGELTRDQTIDPADIEQLVN